MTDNSSLGDGPASSLFDQDDPEDQAFRPDPLAKIGDLAAAAGIRRVDMFAWRDLDHPEAGGSELHGGSIAERWAAAGIEVTMTTSSFEGASRTGHRDGYRVERPAGRYGIFPAVAGRRAVAHHLYSRLGRPARAPHSATVEIWNGMPFFSPVWSPQPRLVFLHHVHDGMWDLVLPKPLAATGRFIESRLAPPVYRRTPIVTLSSSSRDAIVARLGFPAGQVHVVEPGVDDYFRPGGTRSKVPLVVAVGRLVPYKRFDRLIEVLVSLRRRHPDLEAVIAGEGQERRALQELVEHHQARSWISLPGRIGDDALVELYQRAWVLASSSAYEGWGLTITEAAACATPAVASPIAGHRDALEHGVGGYLAEPGREMEARIDALVSDPLLRRRMQKAARRRADRLTWDRAALSTMRVLADQSRLPDVGVR
ncbi:MAG: glycosyltransferase family 4 protein [Actinomycetota bacterium]|nr:glycosyltransferase family 4 protein [Actinomycetota bacterium]